MIKKVLKWMDENDELIWNCVNAVAMSLGVIYTVTNHIDEAILSWVLSVLCVSYKNHDKEMKQIKKLEDKINKLRAGE